MSDSEEKGTWTRRRFLRAAGEVGGAAAVYETMVALGMLRVPSSAYAAPPDIAPGVGTGKTVVILGAGIAGLTAAYELHKRNSGFTIIVLEAEHRIGGRSYTVRPTDKIVERHPDGDWTQTCDFEKGQYLNAGPGRIPYHHTVALNYCRELKVAVEPYVMSSRANLYQEQTWFKDPRPNRRILNDTRGYIAELLTKAIDKGSLDDTLPPAQKKQMLELLVTFGPLQGKSYAGSQRSGYTVQPGVTTPGTIESPIPRVDILGSQFWLDRMYQPEDYEWQPTLFQPVGGMDMLAKGFLPAVEPYIRREREVTSVANAGDKVIIQHRGPAGEVESIKADWCISTIPVWIFQRLVDASSVQKGFMDALKAPSGAATCKVGWQANRRFWELDDEIYGGISYINHNITQMWYPSNGYLFEEKGVLTGAYNYGDRAVVLGRQSLKERLATAAQGGERLHGKAFVNDIPRDLGLSIAWHFVPHQEGGWADWTGVAPIHYQTLLEPDGQIMVAGDQVSYLPGWQEGAMLSTHHVLRRIAGRDTGIRLKTAAVETVAPQSRAMTEGAGPTREGAQ
jgi:monoamine oxidase